MQGPQPPLLSLPPRAPLSPPPPPHTPPHTHRPAPHQPPLQRHTPGTRTSFQVARLLNLADNGQACGRVGLGGWTRRWHQSSAQAGGLARQAGSPEGGARNARTHALWEEHAGKERGAAATSVPKRAGGKSLNRLGQAGALPPPRMHPGAAAGGALPGPTHPGRPVQAELRFAHSGGAPTQLLQAELHE